MKKERPSPIAEIVHSTYRLLASIVATSITLAACAPTPLQRAVAPIPVSDGRGDPTQFRVHTWTFDDGTPRPKTRVMDHEHSRTR